MSAAIHKMHTKNDSVVAMQAQCKKRTTHYPLLDVLSFLAVWTELRCI